MAVSARREVYAEDALQWLGARTDFSGAAFITSLPDVSELPPLSLAEWKQWFVDAARLILSRCPEDGAAIFFQSDVRKDVAWVDKGYLCQRAAEAEGATLLWHKIVCRLAPGTATHARPAYSHLLCFGKGLKPDFSRAYPDVLPEAGEKNWTRGMGANACLLAVKWVKENTRAHTIIDPFCGKGMVLAVANHLGLDAVGVELSGRRARQARSLQYPPAPTSGERTP